jgi:hypothetical protein
MGPATSIAEAIDPISVAVHRSSNGLAMSGRRPLQPAPTMSRSCGGPLHRLVTKQWAQPLRRLRIRAQPTLLNLPTEGRIDNETTKWIDQGHVERSETTHWFHVDC